MNKSQTEQPILDFKDVIAQKDSTLQDLHSLFQTQGFVFLRFPDSEKKDFMARIESCLLTEQSPPARTAVGLQKTLGGGRAGDLYRDHRSSGTFGKLGFHETPTKKSFSCLTGSELDSFLQEAWISEEECAAESIRALVLELDQHLLQLVEATSSHFFDGKSPQELGKELNIPFLDTSSVGDEDSVQTRDDATGNASSFALFDVALYKNDADACSTMTEKEGGKCAAHYDPGLYTLWVGETQPGLKLKDRFGVWIPPLTDPNVHVLWLGEAAKKANPRFVPAMHRVDTILGQEEQQQQAGGADVCDAPPRLSAWTELCTRKQVLRESVAKFSSAKIIEVKNAFGIGEEEPYRVRVENGDIQTAFRTIDAVLQMPFSKVMRVPIYDEEGFVTGTGYAPLK